MWAGELRALRTKKRLVRYRKDAAALGLTLRVLNDGRHFEWTRDGLLLEWWPETGRIAVNRVCDRHGERCRDYGQALAWVTRKATPTTWAIA